VKKIVKPYSTKKRGLRMAKYEVVFTEEEEKELEKAAAKFKKSKEELVNFLLGYLKQRIKAIAQSISKEVNK